MRLSHGATAARANGHTARAHPTLALALALILPLTLIQEAARLHRVLTLCGAGAGGVIAS